MKIKDKHLFHGAALTQIVEHPSFKALNRASAKYGHYLVNADRHLFVKYRTSETSPWQFNLASDEIIAIASAAKSTSQIWLCLVCGSCTVCALTLDEMSAVIDLQKDESQAIRVEVPAGASCRVNGSAGKLSRTVAHNSFPKMLFA